MAIILTKKSDTSSSVPLAADLTNAAGGAELAVNTADKRLYSKTSGGSVVELGTNPSLMVLPSATSQPSGSANGVPYLNGSKVLTSGSALTFTGSSLNVTATDGVQVIGGGLSAYFYSDAVGGNISVPGNNALRAYINGSEAIRLTSTGLGIGTSSPNANSPVHMRKATAADCYLRSENSLATTVFGTSSSGETYIYNSGAYPLLFFTGATERARIDSSGNLLVGTTSVLGKLGISNSGNFTNARFDNGSSSITGRNVWSTYTGSGNNNTTAIHFAAYDGSVGADVFQVLGNGNVRNQNNSYGAISDLKLKENVVDATPKLSSLMQVRVVNYNLKTDQEHKQLGVIAQELEQVFPGMVEESPDLDMEGNDIGTTTKSVKYSVFVPMLIKAIQEQQAIIEDMKTRLAAAGI